MVSIAQPDVSGVDVNLSNIACIDVRLVGFSLS